MKKYKIEKKVILPGKEIKLEKHDFLALVLAILLETLPIFAFFIGGISLFLLLWSFIFA